MYTNRKTTEYMRYYQSVKVGQQTEDNFQSYMENRGWKVSESNRMQNMKEHWDFQIDKDGHSLKVDVKAAKKINRSDAEAQYAQIWVELMNVRGNIGWLYGKSDYVVFQTADGFSFIKREDLVKVVEEKVTSKKVDYASQALYNLYTRKGRKDVITILNYGDIKPYCKEL